jgi:hypothetical protein
MPVPFLCLISEETAAASDQLLENMTLIFNVCGVWSTCSVCLPWLTFNEPDKIVQILDMKNAWHLFEYCTALLDKDEYLGGMGNLLANIAKIISVFIMGSRSIELQITVLIKI